MSVRTSTRISIAALAAALAVGLAGCAVETTGPLGGSAADAELGPGTQVEGVSVVDGWVKAVDGGMTAMFGKVVNGTDAELTIVEVTSEAAGRVELHETVESPSGERVMREVEGGFVIPAHGARMLEPGADHFMLMDVAAPLVAGDEVEFVLHLSDGSTHWFTVPVKDFAGGGERYESGDSHDDMGGMHLDHDAPVDE